MNFKDVMLSEISQVQKDKYCMIHLDKVPRKSKFIEMESRMVITSGCPEGGLEVTIEQLPVF